MSTRSRFTPSKGPIEPLDSKLDIVDASITAVPAAEIGEIFDYPGETAAEHKGELRRAFKSRHIQMIVMGGCIGSGLFVSSGKALRYGSWTGMWIGWVTVCAQAYATIDVMSEACIIFPTSGAFIDHAARFVDPACGFAIGFCEWIAWISVIASEGAVFQLILSYWTTAVPTAACMTIYLAIVFSIHFLPNKWFAEFEFVTSSIKVVLMIVIIFTCIAMIAGAGPTGSTHHAENYTSLPAFPNGYKGVAQGFLLASWACGGQELNSISNGEAAMPRWSLPRAMNNFLARLFLFYITSIIFITILVPYNEPRLLGTSSIAASPFVIAMDNAGIKGLPDVMNAVMMLGLCAIGAESLYLSSRMSTAMGRMGLFPKAFGRIDNKGRPYVSLGVGMVLATIFTYINCSSTGAIIFTWFSTVSSTVYFLAYIVIAISNFKMRQAFKAQGDNPLSLQYAYKNRWWPLGSVFLVTSSVLILASTFYISLFPIDAPTTAENFFKTFLCVPLFIVVFLAYKIAFKTKWVNPAEADIHSGRRPLTEEDIAFLDKYYAQPWHKRALTYVTF